MNEIVADYTPEIRYIIKSKSYKIMCGNCEIVPCKPHNHVSFLNFINYDFSDFSKLLYAFYTTDATDTVAFQFYFECVVLFLKRIFAFSNFYIAMNFIITDYTFFSIRNYINTKNDVENDYLFFITQLYDFTMT